jgi:hypothetical protein
VPLRGTRPAKAGAYEIPRDSLRKDLLGKEGNVAQFTLSNSPEKSYYGTNLQPVVVRLIVDLLWCYV